MSVPSKISLIALLSLALVATCGTAQFHNAMYVSCGDTLNMSIGTAVTTLYDNPGLTHGIAMEVDNKSLWFNDSASTGRGIFKLDLQTLAITTILLDTINLHYPRDMVINQDGELVLTSRCNLTGTPHGLFRYSGGKLNTIVMAPATSMSWYGGLEIDIDSGKYVVQDMAGTGPLLEIDQAGTINTLATGFNARYSLTQDIRTGNWYSAAYSDMYVLYPGASTPVLFNAIGTSKYYYAIASDRASAANPRIISWYGNAIYYTDISTKVVTSVGLAYVARSRYEMDFHRGREVCTVKMGTGKWAIKLSFPGEAGKNYVLGLGLSGVRPGIPLADNRVINIAFDVLTFLSVRNLLGTYFNPGPMLLDASGEATASIDVSSLGSLGGIRIWIQGVLLDKSGIGIIADPVGITIP